VSRPERPRVVRHSKIMPLAGGRHLSDRLAANALQRAVRQVGGGNRRHDGPALTARAESTPRQRGPPRSPSPINDPGQYSWLTAGKRRFARLPSGPPTRGLCVCALKLWARARFRQSAAIPSCNKYFRGMTDTDVFRFSLSVVAVHLTTLRPCVHRLRGADASTKPQVICSSSRCWEPKFTNHQRIKEIRSDARTNR
jgi:hypothetical protein